MLESSHPFVNAVSEWAGRPGRVKEHRRRIKFLNSVSEQLGFMRGAITNIPEDKAADAAKLIAEKEPTAVPYLSGYL